MSLTSLQEQPKSRSLLDSDYISGAFTNSYEPGGKKMKKTIAIASVLLSALLLSVTGLSCGEYTSNPGNEQDTDVNDKQNSASSTISVEYDSDDLNSSSTGPDISYIILEGDSITLDGDGATVEGNVITITSAGTYSVSGTLNDGHIRVNTEDSVMVKLVLNGADITCSTSAPIYIINAGKTVITLANGTENYITDGNSYILEDPASDEPNAAVFSKDDLTINGGGSLTVKANYNNGITSKDDLKITGGSINVDAVNDGIKGRDCIGIKDGTITLNAGGDGMQSNNDVDSEKGFVFIEGGTFNIIAGADGIQAETGILITGGDMTIATGGGSTVSTTDTAKGIKAGINITIEGGTINIDSADDSIHSNDSITINGGDITLASRDDAIHADSTLQINGGRINITTCYEGIESSDITINYGDIHLVSSDDGINAVSGNGGTAMPGRPGQDAGGAAMPGRPGQDAGNNYLYINGGYIVVDALGDGFDVNGSVYMTSGSLIINGPIRNDNGALDYTGVFQMSGGFLVAVGSSGMAQAPSTSSTQNSAALRYSSLQSAGTMIHIQTEDGEGVLTFVPTKAYQSIVLCSPQMKEGVTYIVYSGGSSTGTVTDGLYSGGTYTPGTELGSFTL
jgi:hypothetical protein